MPLACWYVSPISYLLSPTCIYTLSPKPLLLRLISFRFGGKARSPQTDRIAQKSRPPRRPPASLSTPAPPMQQYIFSFFRFVTTATIKIIVKLATATITLTTETIKIIVQLATTA